MNRTRLIVWGFIVSSIMIFVGALGKIQHWVSIKPLMLVGMILQMAVLIHALIPLFRKK